MPVQVKMLKSLHPMALVIRRGGWLKHNRCVNKIIEPAITDMGESTAYYSQYTRLENARINNFLGLRAGANHITSDFSMYLWEPYYAGSSTFSAYWSTT